MTKIAPMTPTSIRPSADKHAMPAPPRRQLLTMAAALAAAGWIPASEAQAKAKIVLVVGDSLSAEYGLRRGSGWVTLLEQRLADKYPSYRVANASISGETTTGGLARFAPLLQQHKPAIVVLELGANDALRGFDLAVTESNLATMIKQAQAIKAVVVVVGTQMPPNYGKAYAQRFAGLFKKLADAHGAECVPFLMADFAADETLFQADRIHPVEKAQPMMLGQVWPAMERAIKRAGK